MRHFFTIVYCVLAIFTETSAVTAYRNILYFNQPDGSTIELSLVGDEHFHWYLTNDGIPVVVDEKGAFYATIDGKDVVSSNILVHNSKFRSFEEKKWIQDNLSNLEVKCTDLWKNNRRVLSERNRTRALKNSSVYCGNKKGLVILVNFSNCNMQENSPQILNRMFNEEGFDENYHIGSVHDYFYDQSYGLFNLTFDVIGPLTLSHTFGYYGGNKVLTGSDKYPEEMVIEACMLADSLVDYSEYDWNKNGVVDQVFIIYAGYGEATGGISSTIWPHESELELSGNEIILDGVLINTYACSNELYGNSGGVLMGIGTACHEFSHCIGLPDLYDTDYSGAFGMNYWDVMDAGSYSGPNGIGEVPYGYSAYERYCAGWLNLEEITESAFYSLPSLEDGPKAFVLRNEGNIDEFLVFENHQPQKWFSYVNTYKDMHGMMITHIDFDSQSWNKNRVNGKKSHQRESIIPADNCYGIYDEVQRKYYVSELDYRGDLFPGIHNVTRLSSSSHWECGGKMYNQNINGFYSLNMVVDNIKEDNGTISFSVGTEISAPINLRAKSIINEVIDVSWDPINNADSYILEITKIYRSYKIATQFIDNIRDTKYSIINPDNSDCLQYLLRVKAITQYASSDWSELVTLLTSTNSITHLDKNLHLDSKLYDLNGFIVGKAKRSGVYIKRAEDNNIKNVMR